MLLLEYATEFNPSARGHRSPFEFQVAHIGYGKTWEKQSVVEAYSMKSRHPNYTLLSGKFKSFTSLNTVLNDQKITVACKLMTYLAQCQDIGWVKKCADFYL